jgi:hypothetical protein
VPVVKWSSIVLAKLHYVTEELQYSFVMLYLKNHLLFLMFAAVYDLQVGR